MKKDTLDDPEIPTRLEKTPLLLLLVPAVISFVVITLVAMLFLANN